MLESVTEKSLVVFQRWMKWIDKSNSTVDVSTLKENLLWKPFKGSQDVSYWVNNWKWMFSVTKKQGQLFERSVQTSNFSFAETQDCTVQNKKAI